MFLPIQNTMNTSNTLFPLITTTEAAEVGNIDLYDDYKQIYINIEWRINTIAYITVVSGLANILTFIQRGFLKNLSMCFYMSILALADTGK